MLHQQLIPEVCAFLAASILFREKGVDVSLQQAVGSSKGWTGLHLVLAYSYVLRQLRFLIFSSSNVTMRVASLSS